MKAKGIDISYCQRDIDYLKARQNGTEFAIIRSGYRKKTDDMLNKHVAGCTRAGIKYGFYVYATAMTHSEAITEAKHCLASIKGFCPEYPIFYDLEDYRLETLSRSQITEIALAFLGEIKAGGYYAGYYANPAWLENHIDKAKLSDYDLWLAAWTDNPDKPTKYNYGQSMWQWGLDNIDGIGAVDGDICYKNYPEIIKSGGFNKACADTLPEPSSAEFGYLTFSETDKYYRCIGRAVNLRKYPSVNAPILGVLEKNSIYRANAEISDGAKLRWLGINGGFSMYIDQINDILFEAADKPATGFKAGDRVEITKAYATTSCSPTAVNRASIGENRYIVRIIPNTSFPYQLGVKKDDSSSANTTGFACDSGIKKL